MARWASECSFAGTKTFQVYTVVDNNVKQWISNFSSASESCTISSYEKYFNSVTGIKKITLNSVQKLDFLQNTHSSFCRFGTFVEKLLAWLMALNDGISLIAGTALITFLNAISPHLRMLCGLANVYAAKTKVFRNIFIDFYYWLPICTIRKWEIYSTENNWTSQKKNKLCPSGGKMRTKEMSKLF